MSVYFRKNAFKVAKKKTLRINKQINVRNRGIVQTINIGTLPARRARRRRIKPRLNQQSRMIQYIPTMPQRNYPQPYISTEYMSQFEKNKVTERIKKMKTADEKYNNQFKLLREQGEKQLLAQEAMKTSYDDTIKNLRTFDAGNSVGPQPTPTATEVNVESSPSIPVKLDFDETAPAGQKPSPSTVFGSEESTPGQASPLPPVPDSPYTKVVKKVDEGVKLGTPYKLGAPYKTGHSSPPEQKLKHDRGAEAESFAQTYEAAANLVKYREEP